MAMCQPRCSTTPSTHITLRYMTSADKDTVLAFAQALPAHDLLFLRRDITRPEVVDVWLEDLKRERITTVLAEREGVLVGAPAENRARPKSLHPFRIRTLHLPTASFLIGSFPSSLR